MAKRLRLTLIVMVVLSCGGILRPTDDVSPLQAPTSSLATCHADVGPGEARVLSGDEARAYAAREESARDLATFEAGDDVVYIGGGTLLLCLIILLILL